jgi:hypothetical protein
MLTVAAALLAAGFVRADTPADACANLGEARAQLVAMTAEADAGKLDGYKTKIHAASKALDGNLAAMASGPDAAKVQAFKPVWEDFKKTRESEIIPALYAGDKDKAKGLATGIQADRMKQMKAAMGCQ